MQEHHVGSHTRGRALKKTQRMRQGVLAVASVSFSCYHTVMPVSPVWGTFDRKVIKPHRCVESMCDHRSHP